MFQWRRRSIDGDPRWLSMHRMKTEKCRKLIKIENKSHEGRLRFSIRHFYYGIMFHVFRLRARVLCPKIHDVHHLHAYYAKSSDWLRVLLNYTGCTCTCSF